MRHRLFHAVVLVGVALPGCGSEEPVAPATDAAAAADTASVKDTATTTDSVGVDSADAVVDSVVDTNEPDTCIDGCGPMCLPCIK